MLKANRLFSECKDDFIEWRAYNYDIDIYSKFAPAEWDEIISGFSDNDEWNSFLKEYEGVVKCLILYDKRGAVIGFAFIIVEDGSKHIVSVHGGGCSQESFGKALYFRGYIRLLHHLLKQNIKTRTACYKSNLKARKFLKAIGFVKYKETEDAVYLWINEQRLTSSRIYRHLEQSRKMF